MQTHTRSIHDTHVSNTHTPCVYRQPTSQAMFDFWYEVEISGNFSWILPFEITLEFARSLCKLWSPIFDFQQKKLVSAHAHTWEKISASNSTHIPE